MTLPRLALSVIGDEIGPTLDEMISFAHEHGVKRLDMRTVNGRNLLAMTKEEVIAISRRLENEGISVPTFVSPMFKWLAPGQTAGTGKVDFAFHPTECPTKEVVTHAMQIAVILGAPHMRIFSYLRYPGFEPLHLWGLNDDLSKLMGLASYYDITLQLENEPVCNIGNIAELAHLFDPRNAERQQESEDEEFEEENADPNSDQIYLRPLIDIANAWATGEKPSDADIGTLAPLTTAIHLKDRDLAAGRTVPLGEGDLPWPTELRRLLSGVKAQQVLASIETHCPHDPRNATAKSLAGLRRIAAEIGVEIV
jgi:sugar phosphate isomerase/epimerase